MSREPGVADAGRNDTLFDCATIDSDVSAKRERADISRRRRICPDGNAQFGLEAGFSVVSCAWPLWSPVAFPL